MSGKTVGCAELAAESIYPKAGTMLPFSSCPRPGPDEALRIPVGQDGVHTNLDLAELLKTGSSEVLIFQAANGAPKGKRKETL